MGGTAQPGWSATSRWPERPPAGGHLACAEAPLSPMHVLTPHVIFTPTKHLEGPTLVASKLVSHSHYLDCFVYLWKIRFLWELYKKVRKDATIRKTHNDNLHYSYSYYSYYLLIYSFDKFDLIYCSFESGFRCEESMTRHKGILI